jgi:release factor glutamine methyltransferase
VTQVEETLGSLVADAAGALSIAGFEEPGRRARQLVASALEISQTDVFAHPDEPVDAGRTSRFRAILSRMIEREPLSRIIRRREFWGLEFTLSSETLDPRPETETIVEVLLKRKSDRHEPLRILDLGTGTGCLVLALLGEYPRATGFGIDIAEGAVRTAICNAANLGFADRANFFVGDWGAAVSGKFDAIVANPPYIASADLPQLPREVAWYDPWRALDGGRDGLVAYRDIAVSLPVLVASEGIFICEVGANQADAVAAIMRVRGLVCEGIERDLAGIARCVVVRPAE